MDAEELISPRTRFKVLRTLNYSETPISLHEIADRAELVIGPVQTAVSWLLEAKIISVKKLGNRTYFQIKDRSAIEIVSNVQDILGPLELKVRAKQYQNRAKNLFDDIGDRTVMIKKARSPLKL